MAKSVSDKKKNTQSAIKYDLIGQPLSSITGAKLPTVRQVLKFVLFATQIAGPKNDAFEETTTEV